jgi:hypothetical protein
MREVSMLLVALACCSGAAAQDQPAPFTGFYAGVGVGSTEPTVYGGGDYWYYGDYDSGDSTSSTLVFAGWRFHQNFGVELGYIDAGGMGFDDSLVYVPDLLGTYNTDVDLDVTAGELSLVGAFPFARIWEFYGRIGLAYWDAESVQRLVPSFGGPVVHRTREDDGAGFLFGFGGGVTLASRLHLRLEYQFFDIDEDLLAGDDDDGASIDTFLLDAQYRFGGPD